MSKIGRLPIALPSGVTLTLVGNVVTVKGPKGELNFTLPPRISLKVEDNIATLNRASDDKSVRALHGLSRAVVANLVQGVNTGFTKILELQGTGYRARLSGNNLVLSLGFSHEIEYQAPSGVSLQVENTNLITIAGSDRQVVGQVAAKIRSYRPPEPYKGKGIRYQGEVVRRKAGKAAKAAAA